MSWSSLFTKAAAMPLPAAAVFFARNGVPVFPCVPGGKSPLVEHGFKDASGLWPQVRQWWTHWPYANIGIPTGAVSGLEVVDIDVKGAHPRGYDSFTRSLEAGLFAGWDLQIATPSGGLHMYFPSHTHRPQRSWQAARAQVDFRGDGGYIIAPPSRVLVNGVPAHYRLLDVSLSPTGPVDATRLRDFLDPRPVLKLWPKHRPMESVRERAERLATWVGERIDGERNQGLFWASCRLAEAGASPADTVSALGPAAEQIGLAPREIETTIRSAYRAVTAIPAPSEAPSQSAETLVNSMPQMESSTPSDFSIQRRTLP